MRTTDIAIIGGGPAGLSAAIEAARAGAEVIVVDEGRAPGGQLFNQIHKFFGSKQHRAGIRGARIGYELLDEVRSLGVEVLLDTVAWGIFEDHVLGLARNGRSEKLRAKKIILATGATENALSFPGCTLPGVMGAGAAQVMINIHRVLPGQKFLMVGSGNVGLIVSYQLLQAGADVVGVVEAAPKIGGYGVHASKLRRAGVPIWVSHTVSEAKGGSRVEAAVLAAVDEEWKEVPGTEREIEADSICLAVGLSPQTELAWLSGCRFAYVPQLGGHIPVHDENMQAGDGIYVAGDLAGVEEASTAIEEGRLAGIAAAEALGYAGPEEAEKRKAEVRAVLESLRLGPFGDARAAGKRAEMAVEVAR